MEGVEWGFLGFRPGERIHFEAHQWSWFFFVRQGEMDVRSDHEPPLRVREGECFGIDGRTAFGLAEASARGGGSRTFEELEAHRPSGDEPLCLVVAHAPLSANVLLSSFSERVHVSRDDTGPTPARIRALVDFVEDELEGAEGLLEAEGVLQRLAELILVILVRHLVNASASIQAVLPTALVDQRLWRALAAFQRSPESDWTVERLARTVGMSRTAFAVRFRELIGEPPLHVLTRIRMNMAAAMLLRDDAPIKRIAARVGYTTEAAFCRAFARHHGDSPGRWRQRSLSDGRPPGDEIDPMSQPDNSRSVGGAGQT